MARAVRGNSSLQWRKTFPRTPRETSPSSHLPEVGHMATFSKCANLKANIIAAFKHLSIWASRFLAAKVKRAGHISSLTFIVKKGRSRAVLGGREFPGNQLEKKLLTRAPGPLWKGD